MVGTIVGVAVGAFDGVAVGVAVVGAMVGAAVGALVGAAHASSSPIISYTPTTAVVTRSATNGTDGHVLDIGCPIPFVTNALPH